jgi:hypothetical protein
MKRNLTRTGAIVLLWASALAARDRIVFIDVYGANGMDTEAVRRALPFHPGDPKTREIKPQAVDAVNRVTGRDEIALICCDP